MNQNLQEQIRNNFDKVVRRVSIAARSVNRDPNEIKIVVVTKAHPLSVIDAAVNAGIKNIGENYVGEAVEKITNFEDEDVTWHMIGHIQSRKARIVSEYFDYVHSVDRVKLARKLNQAMEQRAGTLPILLECNVSGETSKHGFPAWREDRWGNLDPEIEEITELPRLRIMGLMTIPPWDPDPEKSRLYYKRLVRLQENVSTRFPSSNWNELSMGMSNDFEVAIECGSNVIRVGRAIFGPRQ